LLSSALRISSATAVFARGPPSTRRLQPHRAKVATAIVARRIAGKLERICDSVDTNYLRLLGLILIVPRSLTPDEIVIFIRPLVSTFAPLTVRLFKLPLASCQSW